jgi:hypothetical protein
MFKKKFKIASNNLISAKDKKSLQKFLAKNFSESDINTIF